MIKFVSIGAVVFSLVGFSCQTSSPDADNSARAKLERMRQGNDSSLNKRSNSGRSFAEEDLGNFELDSQRAREDEQQKQEAIAQLEIELGEELQKIFFEFDTYILTVSSQETLQKVAEKLKAHASLKLDISGHADQRGSNEYNLALGQLRAEAIKRYLVDMGVSPERISTVSYGEESPADPENNEKAWAKNRRGELKAF